MHVLVINPNVHVVQFDELWVGPCKFLTKTKLWHSPETSMATIQWCLVIHLFI